MKINSNPIHTTDISIKEQMIESLKLPKDMILGAFVLSMIGKNELIIENFKGILSFTDSCILLQTKHEIIKIEGKDLMIEYYTNEDMRVQGCINSIIFL